MKVVVLIARILLGLVFFIFGSNLLHAWMNQPMPAGNAGAYLGLLYVTHALVVIGFFQFVAGGLLIIARYVPLALTVLAAVLVNIWTYHLLIAHGDYLLPGIVTLLWAVVFYAYRGSFAGIFNMKAQPAV